MCTGFIRDWQSRISGLADVARMPSADLVYTNGAVTLFRIRNPAEDQAGT